MSTENKEDPKSLESTTTTTTTTATTATQQPKVINGNPNTTIPEVWKLVENIPVPNTMVEAFDNTVNRHPNRNAMKVKRNGVWLSWTWAQYREQVIAAAKSLHSLGLSTQGGVNIIGFNSPEWHIAFMGSMYALGVPTGIYTTSAPSQCEYFALNSEAQIVFVEDESQLAKYIQIREKIPNVKAFIVMTPLEDNPREVKSTPAGANGKEPVQQQVLFTKSTYPEHVYTWDAFLQLGKSSEDTRVETSSKTIKSDDRITLIYTSGTTSLPKGCVLTQKNVVWTVYSIAAIVLEIKPHLERFVSYLPLSHIAEQVVTLYAPVMFGILVCFADRDALQGSLLNTLLEVKPTIFFGVPRVWEKIQLKITSILNSSGPLKKKLIGWAQHKGIDGGYKAQKGEKKPRGYGLAKKLVFDKIRNNLGFQYTRLLASAAAPISKDTLNFFLALGITVTEAFGMSELTGPQTLGYPKYKTGSVGKTIPGSEIKIAEDGEICIKGPNCFNGYWKNDEATKETIDSDGWVHTGDIGRLDESGYLFITDRKKELIITAGGENIPPSLIEGFLRQIIGLGEAVVIGDRQKYLVALFTPSMQAINTIPPYGHPLPKTIEEASTDKYFNEYVNNKVQDINSKLPNVQTIKKFKILPLEFSETGVDSEITPTKKLKRKVITKKYEQVIRDLYGDQYTEGDFGNANQIPLQNSPSFSALNNNVKPLTESVIIPESSSSSSSSKPVVVEEKKPEVATPVKLNESNDTTTKQQQEEQVTIVANVVVEENVVSSTIALENSITQDQLKVPEFNGVLPPTSLIVGTTAEETPQSPILQEAISNKEINPIEQEVVEQPKPIEQIPVVVEEVKPPVVVTEDIKPVEQEVVEQPKPVEQIPVVVEEVKPPVEQPKPVEQTPVVEEVKPPVEQTPIIVSTAQDEAGNHNNNDGTTPNENDDKPKEKDASSDSSSYTSDSSDSSDSTSDSSSYTTSSSGTSGSDSSSSYTKSGSSVNTSENESHE